MQAAISELTYAAMLDASPMATSVVDGEGTVVYVNDAFLEYASKAHGREIRREDRVGGNVRDSANGGYERDRQEWLSLYDRVLKGGETIFLEELRGSRSSDHAVDGLEGGAREEMYVDLRMNPIKDPDGQVIAAVMIWQDVTDRVKRQREERRRAALDQVRGSVYGMEGSVDMQRVLSSLYAALTDLGMDFEGCSVQIVDEEKGCFTGYGLRPDGVYPVRERPARDSAVYEAWRGKRPIYRRDLDAEDRYNVRMHVGEASGKPIRSVLDVPFSHGTIAVNSVRPEAFSEEEIETLGQFAGVLSEAYTRFEDIRKIEASGERFRRLFEQSNDAVFLHDFEGRILEVNERACEMLGYARDQLLTMSVAALHPEEVLPGSRQAFQTIDEKGSVRFESQFRRKDGTIIEVDISSGVVEAEGRIIQGIVRDITEQKHTEDMARIQRDLGIALSATVRLEETLRLCVDAAIRMSGMDCGGVYLVDKTSGSLDLAYQQGLPPEFVKSASHYDTESANVRLVMEGKSVYTRHQDLGVPLDETRRQERLRAIAVVPVHHEGTVIACLNIASHTLDDVPASSRQALETIAIQIGSAIAQRQMEQALRESEEKFKLLAEKFVVGIFVIQDKEMAYVNPSLAGTLGYEPEEIIGRLSPKDLIHPDDIQIAMQRLQERLRGEIERSNIVYKATKKDGSLIHVEVYGVLTEFQGRPAVMGTMIDVTERKRAEEELKKFKTASDRSSHGMAMCHLDGSLIYVNESFAEMHGYRVEELIGKHLSIFHTEEQMKDVERLRKQLEETGSYVAEEVWHKRKDGTVFPTLMTGTSIEDDKGRPSYLSATARDITASKRLEEQLRQAQKMEAIGTLAGGIAHDFNNILAVMLGYTDMVLSDLPKDSPIRDRLEEVAKVGDRAKTLVSHILTFSRQSEQERIPVQISPVAKEALKLLRASLPSTIEIREDITSFSTILADPTEIHQVLVNLCTNAAHAMREKGGVLEVSLHNVELDAEDAARYPDLSPGPYLRLTVSDTGHGMDQATIGRIFDPYFTTKRPGEGTGLGLAVMHGIVRNYGGAITAYSEPGRGTTFHLILPRIERESAPEEEISESIPRGNERILFVDDEETLAGMMRGMLEHLGYSAVVCTNSTEALEVFRAQPDRFDLVVTDYTMPRMTGVDLARELLRIRPDVPIILCTGFSETIPPEQVKDVGIREFAMKPMITREVAQLIRKVLDA